MTVPKAFISYSHDTLEHKKWVLQLATRLRNNGIDAILDQFELQAGDDIPRFMENNLNSSDKIIMICTEKYVSKANKGEGGVGYEKMIITSALMKKIDENKIIPIIRQQGAYDVPIFLQSKLYIDFSKEDDFEFCYDTLVRTIHQSPLFVKPPVGNNPFKEVKEENIGDDAGLTLGIIKRVVYDYNNNSQDYLRYTTLNSIMAEFKMTRIYAELILEKIISLGYIEWNAYGHSLKITNKGKVYALNNGLLK